jgi:hypothetical protein
LITTDSTDEQEHSVVIPHPFETEEKQECLENCDKATSLMIDDFIKGLQPVIWHILPKKKYSSLQEVSDAEKEGRVSCPV